jgi:hypothetical protein
MSNQWHGGKGSAPRKSNDQKTYADNWDKIFGNKSKEKEKPEVDPADTTWEDLADD